MKFVGVTSCPTGIAHTYMAAEGLEMAAKEAGHEIDVEAQGSAGFQPLSAETIAAADAVIFAVDVPVRDRARFAGKPLVEVEVRQAVIDSPGLIRQAVAAAENAAAPRPAFAPVTAQADVPAVARGRRVTDGLNSVAGGRRLTDGFDPGAPLGRRIRSWMMTGVSYMIPFVAAGGIMIALSFMLAQLTDGKEGLVQVVKFSLTTLPDHINIVQRFSPTSGMDWAGLLFVMGTASFSFLLPILSGFIAFAIADRPGLAPGIVGGLIAATMNTGFLGGIVTGFIGGFAALWISRWTVPNGVRGIMPVVVIPLLSTFFTAAAMILIVGRPLAAASDGLSLWLLSLSGSNLIILGVILGLMMGFDLGGPVNKVAYMFATTGLVAAGTAANSPALKIMAAVMAAGMVAPLGMALATTLRPKYFSEAECESGRAAWLLGVSFITEGAIPFAAADPWRVIVSSMAGSAVTGGLVMLFGNTLRAPHGGIWVLPLIGSPLLYVIAILIGTAVTAAVVVSLKAAGPGPVKTKLDVAEPVAV